MYGYGYKYTASGSIGSNVNQPATISGVTVDSFTDTGFVVSALVTPGSSPVTPSLAWGLTTGYAGTPVDATEGEISEATTVHFIVTGATQNSLYHFKVVAGEVESADATLTTLNTELITYETGLTTALSSAQRTRLNTLISALKTATSSTALSSAFDTLYILAAETAESALRNLVKNAHYATAVNSPAFAAFEGFTGNGTNAYIDTNYKALSQGVAFTQNSASQGVYVRKNIAESRSVAGSWRTGGNGTHIITRTSLNYLNTSLTSLQSSSSELITDARGMHISTRVNYTEYKNYINGALFETKSGASVTLEDFNDYILAWNGNGTAGSFSTQQVAIRFRGRGFTESEVIAINEAFDEYMTDAGKNAVFPSPAVVFTFDDGYENNYTIGKPVFEAKNARFTTYVTTGDGYISRPRMSPSQLREMVVAGFDMQCHTNSHPHLPTLTESQILAEYDAVDAYFVANGLEAPKHTAYPFADYDAAVMAATAQKRLTGRAAAPRSAFYPTVDKFDIRSYEIDIIKDDITELNSIKLVLTNLVTSKRIVCLVGHEFYDDADSQPIGPSIQVSYIEELIDHAHANGITILTMSQLYDRIMQLTVTV